MAYPPDLLSNILCRLRVQSLKRLQCVCKSWYAIISNPSFVTQHLDYHSCRQKKKNTHSCFLLSHSVDIRYKYELPADQRKDTYFSLVSLDETTDEIVSVDWLKFSNYSDQEKRFSNYWYEDICILGPRNGIYCLLELSDEHGDVIALMNVSSREFKVVPKPEQSIIWHTGSISSRKFVEIGFDPKTNDYKVFFFKDSTYPKERVRQAAVYHVSSNSWKTLNDPLLNHVTMFPSSFVTDTYVNGNVHWLAFEGDPSLKDGFLLSFDMVGEVCAKLKLPDSRIFEDEYDSVIAVRNQSLSLIVHPSTPQYLMEPGDTKCFDVWVMQEYGNDRTWTKQFTIGPIASAVTLLSFWRNGEFLLEDESGRTFSYNPGTQKITMERLCFAEGLHLCQSCVYSESLVSVTGNAPSDFQILVEDIPFLITPHMKRVLDYIDKLEIVNIVPRV